MDNLKIEYIPVGKLKPYEKNARKHKDFDVDAIVRSIEEFGFSDPIGIWSDKNIIVEGHGRLLAAKKLGMTEVPCIRLDHLTDEQRRAYALAHNKTAENSEWDLELLPLELEEIVDIDMTQFGFDVPEDEPEIEEDEVPEVPDEPQAKLGDIYQLGRHRLMCGDSTDSEMVETLINGEIIDMVFTDPPYGINLDGDNSKRGSATSLMKGGLKLKSFVDDSIEYAEKAFDIVQNIGVKTQVWFGANYYCHHLPQTNNWLIWDKRVEDKMNNTNSDAELAWVLDGHQSCRIFRHLWNGLIKASENGQRRVHPTQKPIALVEWCINKYDPECNVILDLFGGSGTTLIAAEQMGRTCYMMELDPHYVDVIIARWENLTGEKAVLLNGEDGV